MIAESSDKIPCVDDEANILYMFQHSLGRQYTLYTANCSENALKLLREHPDTAVIISDYHMPNINGMEFLKLAQENAPDCVQIMLTDNIDLDIAIEAINEAHVFRYQPKPCPTAIVSEVVVDALAQYHLIIDRRQLARELELKNQELRNQRQTGEKATSSRKWLKSSTGRYTETDSRMAWIISSLPRKLSAATLF